MRDSHSPRDQHPGDSAPDEPRTPDVPKLERAFAFVSPAGDWRAPIRALVYLADLAYQDVTVADVVEAIGFYTATEAKAEPIGSMRVLITALGYRAGPAGP